MKILNWVNVNKRLPKDRQWVLIAHFEGSVEEAVFIEGGVNGLQMAKVIALKLLMVRRFIISMTPIHR